MYILFVDTEHQKQDAITHIATSHIFARRVWCAVGRSHRSVGHIGRSVTSRTSSIAYGLSTLYPLVYRHTVYHGTCILCHCVFNPYFTIV